MRTNRLYASLCILLLLAGCSAAQVGSGTESPRNRLTEAELRGSSAQSVYDAIQRLRPEWLTTRGPTSVTNERGTPASVFIDGQIMGGPEYLRDIRIMDVREVKYWPASTAAARFGMGHPRGVIEVLR